MCVDSRFKRREINLKSTIDFYSFMYPNLYSGDIYILISGANWKLLQSVWYRCVVWSILSSFIVPNIEFSLSYGLSHYCTDGSHIRSDSFRLLSDCSCWVLRRCINAAKLCNLGSFYKPENKAAGRNICPLSFCIWILLSTFDGCKFLQITPVSYRHNQASFVFLSQDIGRLKQPCFVP